MVDRRDEGGDPACWAHLFDEDETDTSVGEESEDLRGATGLTDANSDTTSRSARTRGSAG